MAPITATIGYGAYGAYGAYRAYGAYGATIATIGIIATIGTEYAVQIYDSTATSTIDVFIAWDTDVKCSASVYGSVE